MKPCNNCPWRKDAPPGYWDPQHFADIWRNCQGDALHSMLCHKSKPAESVKIPCAGHVAVVGFDSIGVRILAATGRVRAEDVGTGPGDELYPSFAAMMQANGFDVEDGSTEPARKKGNPQ